MLTFINITSKLIRLEIKTATFSVIMCSHAMFTETVFTEWSMPGNTKCAKHKMFVSKVTKKRYTFGVKTNLIFPRRVKIPTKNSSFFIFEICNFFKMWAYTKCDLCFQVSMIHIISAISIPLTSASIRFTHFFSISEV